MLALKALCEEGRPFGAHRASKTADEDLLVKTVHALTATRLKK